MKARIILLFSIFFLGSAFTTHVEQRVTGTVRNALHQPLENVKVSVKETGLSVWTDDHGAYSVVLPPEGKTLVFELSGFQTEEVAVAGRKEIDMVLQVDIARAVDSLAKERERRVMQVDGGRPPFAFAAPISTSGAPGYFRGDYNTEDYSPINEQAFHEVMNDPLSTFSIDVDAASYTNVRRFLEDGNMPPVDAVRIEEMINYFNYDYPQPEGNAPVSISMEISEAPWNTGHRLVQIGLQGRIIPTADLPPSNLVFLVDVSGSMQSPNKLPLLKQAFKLLTGQLRPQDRVAIVTYAGSAGVALEPTPGDRKRTIRDAIEGLRAGGSTAGGAGIRMAYSLAREHFMKEGNNRVILATDGDFNVGVSSDGELQRLIEQERESGVFLSVLGFGMGNYKDNKLELLADKGNGNYAYIDTFSEARKVFVKEFGGTLFTIASDVKLRIEFNPRYVKSYRLIGYENRMLNDEDFTDDKKDAGEIGSGHTVTALYEIIPADGSSSSSEIDLKYQERRPGKGAASGEVLTLKLRYKEPGSDTSREISRVLTDRHAELKDASGNFRFAAAVAGFGLLLRDSEFKGAASYGEMIRLAEGAKGQDSEGYRAELIGLMKTASLLDDRYASRPGGE